MAQTFVPAVRRFLAETGLFGPAFWVYKALREWSPALERRNRALRAAQPAHLPLPPSDLVFAVTASRDLLWFLEHGQKAQRGLADIAHTAGLDLSRAAAVLDFGCGCGRVLRHWDGVLGPGVLHGSDYNARAIGWVQGHLQHVTAATNQLAPPLRYADDMFDYIYALSVFTHLTRELETAWLAELHRVLKPGGRLLVTLQGDRYRPKFTEAERARYDAGDLVVRQESLAGTNWCATFHPEAYVRRVFGAEFMIERYETGAMPGVMDQDVVLLQKPAPTTMGA
jgi:SAM-dependent methyltransferase